MMGLALRSQDLGHIVIRSIKVGFHDTTSQQSFDSTNSDCSLVPLATPIESKARSKVQKKKACLLITFWCREITGIDLQIQKRRFFQNTTKQLLHPATQLIMSIMSSDWNEYDAKIAELCSLSLLGEYGAEKNIHNTDTVDDDGCSSKSSNNRSSVQRIQQRIPSISFFPSKMNLEDVFQRISGVSSSLLISDPKFDLERRKNIESPVEIENLKRDGNGKDLADSESQDQSDWNNCSNVAASARLTTLPGDVLCHNIGQYLRAKSLDSLRCTCKHLHWTLRAVVPGLKLRLYTHQIKSLMWMRGRESKRITEDDLLQAQTHRHRRRQGTNETQSMTQWIKHTPDGDVHRAATGGGTVVLCPQRWQKRDVVHDGSDADAHKNAAPVRVSQFDHSEVMESRKFNRRSAIIDGRSGGDNPLARKVARGGLLCDDPGLGTYTMRFLKQGEVPPLAHIAFVRPSKCIVFVFLIPQ
jgi:hypothetical protein